MTNEERLRGRTEGFSFDVPVTFYGVMEPGGFIRFMGASKEGLAQIRQDMCNGQRGIAAESDVHLIQFTITDITREALSQISGEQPASCQTCVESQQNAIAWMKRHDRLLGFIQTQGLLKNYLDWKEVAQPVTEAGE